MTDLSLIPPLVADAYRNGGQMFFHREAKAFTVATINPLDPALLVRIELNKVGILRAIAGIDGATEAGEIPTIIKDNDATTPDQVIESLGDALRLVADALEAQGQLVREYDVISEESLNRHYYHFSAKMDILAQVFRALP